MTTLIASEWYKLLRGKVLVLILAGVALETLVQVLAAYSVHDNEIIGQSGILVAPGKSFIMQIWFSAFAGFFVASEFQNGTMRNVLALGKNRLHVFLSKQLSVSIAVAAIYAVVSITATAGFSAAFGFGDMELEPYLGFFFWNFFMQLIYHLALGAIFNLIAFLCRNTGLTILLGVGYMLATQVIVGYLGNYPEGKLAFVLNLFPQHYISAFSYLSDSSAFVMKGVIVSAAYFVFASLLGYAVFKKSDIK